MHWSAIDIYNYQTIFILTKIKRRNKSIKQLAPTVSSTSYYIYERQS